VGPERGFEPLGVRQVAALPGELVGLVAEQDELFPVEEVDQAGDGRAKAAGVEVQAAQSLLVEVDVEPLAAGCPRVLGGERHQPCPDTLPLGASQDRGVQDEGWCGHPASMVKAARVNALGRWRGPR
jgi:hypothetical protein